MKREYKSASNEGKKLIAHELTHVMHSKRNDEIKRAVNIEDCSRNQMDIIYSVRNRALEMLRNAINELSASTLTTNVIGALDHHFQSHNSIVIAIVKNAITRILNDITAISYECEEPTASLCQGSHAYTYWALGDIHICPSFFNLSLDEQAETIIHEASHLLLGTFDMNYEYETSDYLSQWTITALNNADSYSQFVYDIR